MNAKITEIFSSIQGEGPYVGVQQVFVRFFGCNMHCVWCDTPESIGDTTQNFVEYGVEELCGKINGLWGQAHSVSITGGEPLMQVDVLQALLPKLKESNRKIHLETNGIFHEALASCIDQIDVVAMDMKLPSSTQCRSFWKEHEEFLKVARQKEIFIKVVISSKTEKEDVLKAIDCVSGIDPQTLFILQPNSLDMFDGVVDKCLAFHEDCLAKLPNTRIMPQMHKFMNLE